jgi:hypothetical protein
VATNQDGTVTLKTAGKLAVTPKSSGGTVSVKPVAYKGASAGGAGPYTTKQAGRVAVARSATAH